MGVTDNHNYYYHTFHKPGASVVITVLSENGLEPSVLVALTWTSYSERGAKSPMVNDCSSLLEGSTLLKMP